MRRIRNDENGYERVFVLLFVIGVGIVLFVLLPILIGWAFIFIWQFFTESTETYSLLFKWLMGVAVIIVVIVLTGIFRPHTIEKVVVVTKDWHYYLED